jgi:hypothetical protein
VTEAIVESPVAVDWYENALIPIDVTLFGIVIEDKYFVESRKDSPPIVTRPSFNVSDVKLLRLLNALVPIVVTFPGIVRVVALIL